MPEGNPEATRRAPQSGPRRCSSNSSKSGLIRFPRHPRTQQTNSERIRRYILPYLPRKGRFPITELRRASLRHVQAELLKRLAKETIDGAFSAFSAMLRDAVDIELLDANPAHGIRVRPNDPRLNPARTPRSGARCRPTRSAPHRRGTEPPPRGVLDHLPHRRSARRAVRTRARRPRSQRQMIYVHQTVNRYGKLEPGRRRPTTFATASAEGAGRSFPRA